MPSATHNLKNNGYKRLNVIAFVITELVLIYRTVLGVLLLTISGLAYLIDDITQKQVILISIIVMVFLSILLWTMLSKYVFQKLSIYKDFYIFKRALERHFDFSILATVFTIIISTLTYQYNGSSNGFEDKKEYAVNTLMLYTFTATLAIYSIKHGFRRVFLNYEEKFAEMEEDLKI